jgi:hypothetical protein
MDIDIGAGVNATPNGWSPTLAIALAALFVATSIGVTESPAVLVT